MIQLDLNHAFLKEDVEETFELFFALFSSILLDRPCLRKKAGPS